MNSCRTPVFTVFTPTYNRGDSIHRLYESLKKQTFKGFEWLIVDDSDNPDDMTSQLVLKWKAESDFDIVYHRRSSRGKHLAWNIAVDLARGELFYSIDSDDYCVPHCLQLFHDTWMGIPESQRANFTGVTGLTEDERGVLSGTRFPLSPLDSDSMEIRYKYKVTGEKSGFHRTSVMREFRFPPVENASYFPEFVLWSRIANKYKTRYINEVVRVWFQPPFDPTRLTQAPGWTNAEAKAMAFKARLDEAGKWLPYAPVVFLKSAVQYSRLSKHAGRPWSCQWKDLVLFQSKLLWLVTLPVGMGVYLRDLKRKRSYKLKYNAF